MIETAMIFWLLPNSGKIRHQQQQIKRDLLLEVTMLLPISHLDWSLGGL